MREPYKNPLVIQHVERLCTSYELLLGNPLISARDRVDKAQQAWHAPFFLVSHGTQTDPIFNYANQQALDLWEMSWDEFTTLPSRRSAAQPDRAERAQLLKQVSEQGYSDAYRGLRMSKHGRRFYIENAIIWNCYDELGRYYGQAACCHQWTFVD